MASIRYLGHSGFEISMGDTVSYIDVFTGDRIGTNVRRIPNVLDPRSVRKADFVFITHEHEPHCDVNAVKTIADRNFASVVGPKQCLAKIDVNERLKVDVSVGDKFSLKGLDIEVVKAVHPQSVYPVGYVLRKGGLSIYHAGDTYAFAGMAAIKADVVILPIGGAYTMDPIAANTACKEMRPKLAIPMHYGTYERIEQDPHEFAVDLGRTKAALMKPGQTLEI